MPIDENKHFTDPKLQRQFEQEKRTRYKKDTCGVALLALAGLITAVSQSGGWL